MNCIVSDGEGISGIWFWLGEPIMYRMTVHSFVTHWHIVVWQVYGNTHHGIVKSKGWH